MSRLILKYTNNLSRSKPAVSVLLDVCSRNAVKSSRYSSTPCEMSRLSPLICPTMLRRRQLICQGLTNVKTIQKYCTQKTDDVPFVVKLFGLYKPKLDAKGVLSFLGDNVDVVGGEKGVHFENFRREANVVFVEVADEKSLDNALQKDKEKMRKGYARVFRSNKTFMDICCKRGDLYQTGCLVKITNLPFECSTTQITEFFEGLEVVPDGIYRDEISDGQYTSLGFVQFASQEMAKKALLRNFDRIHGRHIEVRPHSPSVVMDGNLSEEMIEMQSLEESTGNRTIHSVLMSGLPDTADETDVKNFFAPLKVTPVRIEIHLGENSADAVVFFNRFREVRKALEKQNSYIGQNSIQMRANPMDRTHIQLARKKWIKRIKVHFGSKKFVTILG